jgi:hypothetical protein
VKGALFVLQESTLVEIKLTKSRYNIEARPNMVSAVLGLVRTFNFGLQICICENDHRRQFTASTSHNDAYPLVKDPQTVCYSLIPSLLCVVEIYRIGLEL